MPSIQTHDVPTIRNYKQALDVWTQRKPWRKGSAVQTRFGANDMHKPLRKENRGPNMRIAYNDKNGDVELWLYATRMVTYHPNGDLTINAYSSRSSRAFVNCVTPATVSQFDADAAGGLALLILTTDCEEPTREGDYYDVRLKSRLYRHDREYLLRRVGESAVGPNHPIFEVVTPDGKPPKPWTIARADTKKLNAICREYRLDDFRLWEKSRRAFDNRGLREAPWPRHVANILEDIKVPDNWNLIYEEFRRVPSIYNLVRRELMMKHDAVKMEYHPFMRLNDLKKIVDSARKYRWCSQYI
jgi:hypothetical protein